jgi:hypothetical protein
MKLFQPSCRSNTADVEAYLPNTVRGFFSVGWGAGGGDTGWGRNGLLAGGLGSGGTGERGRFTLPRSQGGVDVG